MVKARIPVELEGRIPLLGRARHSCVGLTDGAVLDEDNGDDSSLCRWTDSVLLLKPVVLLGRWYKVSTFAY